ncbi:hypothetical protein LCGC14_0997090 [marine sediment metagenome]|uniref:Uncharacterized protein n=1 Tax=marine sediment metagenome TaxID=412755 RepID=A0A0F9N450_9ZZZZ
MALMEFREPNQVAWYGSRPAHRGTQVNKFNTSRNTTTILHTVAPGKTLFISFFTCSLEFNAADVFADFFVRDTGDTLSYRIIQLTGEAVASFLITANPNPPIEVPSGFDIALLSSSTDVAIRVFIHGWEE